MSDGIILSHCKHGVYLQDDICMESECFLAQHVALERDNLLLKGERIGLRGEVHMLRKVLSIAHAYMSSHPEYWGSELHSMVKQLSCDKGQTDV